MNDPSAYARQIETYLCQKNRGHLIRVVGPAFDLVCSWAAQGVPLKIAFRGIDRCCERHDRKGTRRRPVRIEFCEADVLDAFDGWRRSVGVGFGATQPDAGAGAPRKAALAAHIERAIARLAHSRGVGPAVTALHRHIDDIIRELEQMAQAAARLRGGARATLIAQLGTLDDALMETAIGELDSSRLAALESEAAQELAPFAARMPADVKARAIRAALVRLVRESSGLPVLGYE